VTSHDYLLAMTTVRIADLKARLSAHLRAVRRGRTLTVLDRDTPVARLVPYAREADTLRVRRPRPGAPRLHRIPLPPPLRLRVDVVALLSEERQHDR
jgi:antitoxin (DNA-binding transcriptional repressor) of toxin-antitoxin stability system